VAADLATWDGVEKLDGAVEALGRPVAALCANAGVGVQGPFLETSLDDELRMIHLNVVGQVHLVKRIVRPMAELGHGRILITSSVAGVLPAPYMAVYAATKAFDRFFAEGLRGELKDRGVTVTALEPGPVDTNFFERADMMDTRAGQGPKADPAKVAEAAFDALMDGKDHVLPGAMAKMMGATEFLPDTVRARIHGEMTKPQER
jgi:short-subunit dehydrogenase